jgi:hypothetical protein
MAKKKPAEQSYLIADEQKHNSLLAKLVELKRATVFVT